MPSPSLPGFRGKRSNRGVQMEEVETEDTDVG